MPYLFLLIATVVDFACNGVSDKIHVMNFFDQWNYHLKFYAAHIHSSKHKAVVWCLFVCLSVPFFNINALQATIQLQCPMCHHH